MIVNEVKALLSNFVGSANFIAFPRILMDMCNRDADITIFLSQLMYWHDRSKDGWVYKTYEDFEKEICLSRRKVRKAKDFLERKGWIETDFKQVINGTPKLHYRITDKLVDDMADYLRETAPEKPDEQSDHSILPNTTWPKRSVAGDRNGQLQVTETVSSLYTEITDKDYIQRKDLKHTEVTNSVSSVPYDQIIEIYHNKCPSLRRVQKLTDFRKKLLNARWKEYPSLDFWENYFETVSKSAFLTGKVTDFEANFEWLIRPNNFVKVLEGNYNGKEKNKGLKILVDELEW